MYIWVVNIIPTWKLLGTTFIVQYVATEQWIGSSKWNSDARLAVLNRSFQITLNPGLNAWIKLWHAMAVMYSTDPRSSGLENGDEISTVSWNQMMDSLLTVNPGSLHLLI